MKNKSIQVAVAIIFTSALVISGMTGGRTEQEEIRKLQDAIRNLKRVDNLHFSCKNIYSGREETENQRVEVWADQLSGSWVSELYILDEDGTRLTQKRFCDGDMVYTYIDWNGDWSETAEQDTAAPYLTEVTALDYDGGDVSDIRLMQAGNHQKISYLFTSEYLTAMAMENLSELEAMYQNYQKSGASKQQLDSLQLTVDQYKKMKQENVSAVFTIDENGVLCNRSYLAKLKMPQMIMDENGESALGEEEEIEIQFEIEIKEYNQSGILNKIGQCRNEIYEY